MSKLDTETNTLILKATNIVLNLINYGYDIRFNSNIRHYNKTVKGELFGCSVISGNFTFAYGIGGLNPEENNFKELFSELERLKELAISGVFNATGITYETK